MQYTRCNGNFVAKSLARVLATACVMLICSSSGIANAIDEDSPVIAPVPAQVVESRVFISGISTSHQVLKIYKDGLLSAETRSNESGDWAVAVALDGGPNFIEAVAVDFGEEKGHSQVVRIEYRPCNNANEKFEELVAGPSEVETLPAPVLNQPPTPTTSNPITVTGTGTASTTIVIFVNSRMVNSGPVDGTGHFSIHVPLEDSANSIYGVVQDSSGQSPASNTVAVSYSNQVSRNQGGTLTQDTAWTRGDGTPYSISTDLIVPPGTTLWLEPGATLQFAMGKELLVQGALVTLGTSVQRVILRSANASPQPTDWVGVQIASTSIGTSIDHAQIQHAVYGVNFEGSSGLVTQSLLRDNYAGVNTHELATPIITNQNEITANTVGVEALGRGVGIGVNNPNPVVTGNSIYGNVHPVLGLTTDYAAISFDDPVPVVLDATGNWWGTTDPGLIAQHIQDWSHTPGNSHGDPQSPVVNYSGYLNAPGGTPVFSGPTLNGPITSNQILAAGTYQALGDVEVEPGATLTVNGGTEVDFATNATLRVKGSLTVQGNASQRAIFKSARVPPPIPDWIGIEIQSGAAGVVITYADIENATYGIHFINSTGTVTHSLIKNNYVGIFIGAGAGSTPSITNGNEITANTFEGIWIIGDGIFGDNPIPVISGNSIYANLDGGSPADVYTDVYYDSGTIIHTNGNWWGTTDGDVIADHIYDHYDASGFAIVDYSGFLDGPAGQPFPAIYGARVDAFEVKPLQGVSGHGTWWLNTPGTVATEIRRENDSVIVRSTTQQYAAGGLYQLSWDGRDDSSNIVPSLTYRTTFSGTTGSTHYTYDAPALGLGYIGPDGPSPDTFAPFRNEFWKYFVDIPQNQAPEGITLDITPNGGAAFSAFRNIYRPIGAQWVYWDGRDPTGQIVTQQFGYFFTAPLLRITSFVVTGTQPEVTGTGAEPNIEVKTNPYLIVHSYEEFSTIVYRIDLDSYVTVKLLPPGIYDPSNPAALMILNNVLQQAKDGSGQPINHSVQWLGYNAGDVNHVLTSDEGVFTFTIEARSQQSNVSTLYRGVLQVRR